jgi:hypothetical protein
MGQSKEVRAAARDALGSIGVKVNQSQDGMTSYGNTGWTLFSFGERVTASLQAQDGGALATVRSKQRMPVALLDLGGCNRATLGAS